MKAAPKPAYDTYDYDTEYSYAPKVIRWLMTAGSGVLGCGEGKCGC